MTDQNFKDWKELYEYASKGLPIVFNDSEYSPCITGKYALDFDFKLHNYTKPLPPKKEWFQVAFYLKGDIRPRVQDFLYQSKEEFLSVQIKKESDYEWIKLVKVEI